MSLHSTRGIVLQQVKYAENSLIVKIYTELFGLQTYMVKGVRKKKASIHPNLFQHLSLLDLVVYHKEKPGINHLREVHSAFPFSSIPFDIHKSSLAIFINEIIVNSLKEEEQNKDLFEFLFTSIQLLDATEEKTSDFHLWFCVQFSRFLGFFPSEEGGGGESYFDLREGIFCHAVTGHNQYLNPKLSSILFQLMQTRFETLHTLQISHPQRLEMIRQIIDYYRIHLQGFKEIRSNEILQKVIQA